MATLADSLVSSSARILPMRKRADLSARRQRYQGRVYWVVKEPVGLNYFRFQEEEYAILQLLDGTASLDSLKDEFEARFPPQKITVEEIQQFLGMLHRSGLIVADVPGQGHQLRKRRDERARQELLQKFTNILAIRFKGIDPERLLKWLYPKLWFLFTRVAMALWLLLALSALTLVLVQFDVFQSKLPTFHQFFTVENAMWFALALGVTKVIHEFGHGLTCTHFGGECHEMGVMILVLTPCLYCNVSDSWMLPNKWQRAMIGAAGIYVEVLIASVCTFVWWFSEPGLLNHLCLSTMFVCSVSTIVFNGNPLLRYDGYYILADIMEIPNLRQKATSILSRKLGSWCLGLEQPDDPFLPERNQMMFALYSVAAAVYRWFVVFSIMWFLYQIWKPYRLEIIGQIIGIMALYSLLIQPLWKVGKFFYVPGRIERVKKPRMFATLGLLATVVAAVLFVPLPFRVFCTVEVEPRDAKSVYIEPGQLTQVFVKSGEYVESGTPLAQLRNLDLEIEIANYEGRRDAKRTELDVLRQQRDLGDPAARGQIPGVEEELAQLEEQLRQKRTDLERLELIAPVSGTVLPPPEAPRQPDPGGNLPSWSGTPLDRENLGCYFPAPELFCKVGDPAKMGAVLVIDQADIEFVRKGLTADIKLEELPGDTLTGQIDKIGLDDLKVSPRHSSNKAGGDLATKTDESGVERPLNVSYQARVPLDDPDGLLRIGLRGQAKIYAGHLTLGQRLWRYIAQTFNFRL